MEPATPPSPPLVGQFSVVTDVMDAVAAQFPDAEAYVEGDERIGFADWLQAADGVAGAFVDRGVAPGDVVVFLLPSSIDYAIAYAAAALAGAVATGVSTRIGRDDLRDILGHADPALVVVDRTLDLPELPTGLQVMTRDQLSRARTRPGLGDARPLRAPDDPVVIIWTSGTTGAPKGAWFDHRNLAAAVNAAGIMTAPFDRRLLSTPMQHAGYMAKLWDQLAQVQTNVISPTPWTVDAMVELIRDERITVAGGVPTQWEKLLDHPDLPPADALSLRVCVGAMAPVPPELVDRVSRRLGAPMIVRYAMTECPSVTGTSPDDDPEALLRTVGRPQRGMHVDVVDGDGQPVQAGSIGRVRVRGACVMRGYWGRPDLTEQVLDAEGRYTTNDLARFDGNGNLVLSGRATDMYIRGGYNIHPLEVENALRLHPHVEQVAVVGVPAPVIGEIGVACIVPPRGVEGPSLDAVRTWVRERLSDYKAPDRVEIVDRLPLTPMMKVDKAALRRTLAPLNQD